MSTSSVVKGETLADTALNLEAMNPDMRLVVMLREPVARAWSSHQYMRARGFESEADLPFAANSYLNVPLGLLLLALTGEANARAILDTLGHVDRKLAVLLPAALATAIGAGLVHHLPHERRGHWRLLQLLFCAGPQP